MRCSIITRFASALSLAACLVALCVGLIPGAAVMADQIQVPEPAAAKPAVYAEMLNYIDPVSMNFEGTVNRGKTDLPAEISGVADFRDSRVAYASSASEEPSILEIKPKYHWMEFKVTYYTKDEPGMDGKGITATGTKAKDGRTIAVDPDVIPFGTRVYIDGIGYRVAEDCGGAVHGRHIDVYVDRSTGEHLLRRTIHAKLRIVR